MDKNTLIRTYNALPPFSRKVYATLLAGMYAEPGFSDVTAADVATKLGCKPLAVNGAINKLTTAGLVWSNKNTGLDVPQTFIYVTAHCEAMFEDEAGAKLRTQLETAEPVVKDTTDFRARAVECGKCDNMALPEDMVEGLCSDCNKAETKAIMAAKREAGVEIAPIPESALPSIKVLDGSAKRLAGAAEQVAASTKAFEAAREKWHARFVDSPWDALRWADSAFEAVAMLSVLKLVATALTNVKDTDPVDYVVGYCRSQAIHHARYPEHSTSPCANQLESQMGSAWATVSEILAPYKSKKEVGGLGDTPLT